MKKTIYIIVVILAFQSCSLLERNLCGSYISDGDVFRSHSEAISTNIQFAEDKALLLAKKEIAIEVDNYILEKYNHQTFLADPNFEERITVARKTILTDLAIICSKTIPKKDIYKSYVAIEISKESIDKEVERRLKEEIE